MSNAKPNTNLFSTLEQVDISEDTFNDTFWMTLNYNERPCMTPGVLRECEIVQTALSQRAKAGTLPRYTVLRSGLDGTFNLGGDLAMFLDCIRSGDRERLYSYAIKSIEMVHAQATGFGNTDLTSIALIQGQALGGGFETALANTMIVAEEQSTFSFPECTFGMFPGMGAYNYLARKVSPGQAKQIISSGNTYSAKQMFDMGVVDILAPQGEGERAVLRYIERQRQRGGSDLWLNKGINTLSEVTFDDLKRVVEVWVDASMQLSERNLKLMEFFVDGQRKRFCNEQICDEIALAG